MSRVWLVVLAAWSAFGVLPAQNEVADVPAREREVDVKVTTVLLALAKRAENEKVPSLALVVYEEVLDHYDGTNRQARKGAGWREVKGEWQAPATRPQPNDTANESQRRVMERAELAARRQCAALHRDLGLALLAQGESSRGQFQLNRALVHDPDDAKAHAALGHGEFKGFRGTEPQIAMVKRFHEITAKAKELRELKLEIKTLPATECPTELRCLGRTIPGASAGRISVWVDGLQADANRAAAAAERARLLLDFLAKDQQESVRYQTAWVAFVHHREVYEAMVRGNAANLRDLTAAAAMKFGCIRIRSGSRTGECLQVVPAALEDAVVTHVAHRSWLQDPSAPCGEGLSHAMTWLLCGTMLTKYTSFDIAAADGEPFFSDVAGDWATRIRNDVANGVDLPLSQVLREPYHRFRAQARLKTWSFMLWVCARHPDCWTKLLDLPEELETDQLAADFEQRLGRPIAEVDEEWRAWARPRSYIGKATGLGR